jgi:hypothetical protein
MVPAINWLRTSPLASTMFLLSLHASPLLLLDLSPRNDLPGD